MVQRNNTEETNLCQYDQLTPIDYSSVLNKDFSSNEPKEDLTHRQYWLWEFSIPNHNPHILNHSEGREIEQVLLKPPSKAKRRTTEFA